MAKCYNFYSFFMTKVSQKNHERCSVKSSNAKPVQTMKSCFTVIVHGGMMKEKKITKSKIRKAFYKKIF